MRLLEYSAGTWLLGLGALAATLFALHLLRVRLRRQPVDSLMFFRAVAAVRRPRVLAGPPSRWLAYLLALFALAALWTAAAEPRGTGGAPSRVVVAADRGAAIAESVRAGLGPRGAVLAADATPLLAAGEPPALAAARAAEAPTAAPGELWPALRVARALAGDGGELVVAGGGELGADFAGAPLRRAAGGGGARVLGVELRAWPERKLLVEIAGAERAVLEVAGERLERTVPAGGGRVGFALGERHGRARLVAGDAERAFAIPPRRVLRVRVGGGAPAACALVVAAGAEFEPVAAGADVAITAPDEAAAAPRLVVHARGPAGPRRAVRAAACPLPLSLRDRARDDAIALAPAAGEVVWVEDARSGAPLCVLRSGTPPEVHVVSWLLDDAAHRDVPTLVAGALRVLGGSDHGLDVVPDPPPAAPTPDELEPRARADHSRTWLLAFALLLLAADAWLFWRGRLP